MSTIILNTVITLSVLGILCAFILYVVDQKVKVEENPYTGEIASTITHVLNELTRDHALFKESEPPEAVPCIRCERCVSVCPAGLEPYLLMCLSKKQLWQRAERVHSAECTECGICIDVCPANQPLLEHIRLGKSKTGIS